MSLVAAKIASALEGSSWIRKMFEEGIALKQQYGEDAVCDFSLGNPDLPPPPAVADGMKNLAQTLDQPFALGYMPNAGFGWAREKLADWLSREQQTPVAAADVILTCGVAGGINVFFRAVLDPGDEVLCFAPYFVEYGAYADNHGGVFKPVPSTPKSFAPDPGALEAAITKRTRVRIINSPNNPTGVVYSREQIENLCAVLRAASERNGRPIFLFSDEPYRFLAFDGAQAPSVLPLYPYAVLGSSFSKNLSMPGERLGYLALSADMEKREQLMAALTMTNRTLGFVNPPVVAQHLMAAALGSQVDVRIYERRRNAMANVLTEAGYGFRMPEGAFYFFPEAPGGDDVAFVRRLARERVLGVPGSGFGCPGHFRLAFCVDEKVILRSAEGFARARQG
ncbi:MAG: pyridoxal phosphate-dependent aminotransferase [Deltaproteobacteria bacterium]|jgi:aspartate aminotransferase|nr:pyridoxal phosphate-dependent aminotransferase [Deltaproteobacteria bacterium]